MPEWTFIDADRDHLERYVRPYLPGRIFDAHAHLFCHDHYAPGDLPADLLGTPAILGIEAYRHYIDWLHPDGRTVGGQIARRIMIVAKQMGVGIKDAAGQIRPNIALKVIAVGIVKGPFWHDIGDS